MSRVAIPFASEEHRGQRERPPGQDHGVAAGAKGCEEVVRRLAQEVRLVVLVDPATTGLDEDVGASKDITRAVKRLRDLGVKRSIQYLFAGRVFGLENYIEF